MKVNLLDYDRIVINTSSGKDSQVMLDEVYRMAYHGGFPLPWITVVHADLGNVEWAGSKQLAAEHAAFYKLRFEVERRTQDTLLEYAERRGKWPDSQNRWCTSEFKRSPVARLYTRLAKEWRSAKDWQDRPCRILNCLGFRAEESAQRAKRPVFEKVDRHSTKTTKHVFNWLPIHKWTLKQVWDRIHSIGTKHHPAYDKGMTRLSCVFCIFAPRNQLLTAAVQPENRQLLNKYVQLEIKMDHTFRQDQSLLEIQQAVEAGEKPVLAADDAGGCWNM